MATSPAMTRSSATQTIAAAEPIRRRDKPLALDENAEPMAAVLRGNEGDDRKGEPRGYFFRCVVLRDGWLLLIGLGDELDSDLVVAVAGVGAHHCLVVAG